ncbi:MAG: Holliday junction branch migration protein RuvA [Thermoflexibacter sp.]|jgi:Holliday junction DNA helicase RuvA|nr:Holliday junction branch migration protein RuvA [Thermoflexibacter sp.]
MYAYIKGILVQKEATLAVIEVNGIAYEIRTPLNVTTNLQLNQPCKLYTYLSIKEDAHTLYGFLDIEDKRLFLHLISVSNVGPSTALMALSSLSANEIREAIAREDVRTIQSIKGVGAKTAQMIIVELKDKIRKENLQLADGKETSLQNEYMSSSTLQEAINGLIALGIAKPTAEKTVQAVVKKYGNHLTVEQIIRYALKAG